MSGYSGDPAAAQVAAQALALATAAKTALGATSANGHTVTPVTLAFATVAVGGSTLTMPAVDAVSGPAGVGAYCAFGPSGGVMLPASVKVDCAITATGVATVRMVPIGGVALGAQSITGNVFWWW